MSSAFEGLPKTPNLKLNKPGYDNVADIEALNENADILDAEIQGIKNTFVKSVNGINAGDGGNVDLGIIPISQGGTGQTTASGVRNALGLGNTTGALPIANGGTGATTKAGAQTNLGLNDAIVGLSVSGQTITYTQADGGTGTIITQDTEKPADMSDYIVESYRNGANWYKIYKSGWVEQSGDLPTGSDNFYVGTQTFLKPFADTNYKVFTQRLINDTASSANYSAVLVTTKQTTGFGWNKYTSYSGCMWYACGQGA